QTASPVIAIRVGSGASPQLSTTTASEFACALQEDGRATCWELRRGSPSFEIPTRYKSLAAGISAMCGVTEAGTVECWGEGNGSSMARLFAMVGSYRTVSVGASTYCAMNASNVATCWGVEGATPTKPLILNDAVEVQAGNRHVCILVKSGDLKC